MGVLLRVIGTIVVLALMAAVGESSSPTDALTVLLRLMSFIAPSTLLTLMGWCVARRTLSALDVSIQRGISCLIPAIVAVASPCCFRLPGGEWAALAHGAVGLRAGRGLSALLGTARARFFARGDRSEVPGAAVAHPPALSFQQPECGAVGRSNRAVKAERMLESIAELFRAVMADTRKLVPLADESSFAATT